MNFKTCRYKILLLGNNNKDGEPQKKLYLKNLALPMLNKSLNFGSPRDYGGKNGRFGSRPSSFTDENKSRPNSKRQEVRHRKTLSTDF